MLAHVHLGLSIDWVILAVILQLLVLLRDNHVVQIVLRVLLLVVHRMQVCFFLLPSLFLEALQVLAPALLPLAFKAVKLIVTNLTVEGPQLLDCIVEHALTKFLRYFVYVHTSSRVHFLIPLL